ncbi:MAG: DNA ligase (NAD(+)) LigA [Campylobacteraceae bacterium 4484_166]|nr:MAG: DNA ligase (NAD(+)) LigA [Campylobacteraceae bacterium 4484_166]
MTKEQYKASVKQLIKWADDYYKYDDLSATDDEYDKLNRLIVEYEKRYPQDIDPNSPTLKVGAGVLEKFEKSSHITPMWSQEDIFDDDELDRWIQRAFKIVGHSDFICEPKYDGVSLNLIYKDGKLFKAITRGDGKTGEDVTNNAKTILSIPQTINHDKTIEIRGEVVIKNSDFHLLNIQREKDGKQLFANPRNCAAGSLKQLDSSITSKRKLYFVAWGVGHNSLKMDKISDIFKFLYTLGFKEAPIKKVCKNKNDIIEFYNKMIKIKDNIDIGLDGMVIKYDDIKHHTALGWTVKYPKWSCAYKFPAVEKTTKLNGILLQVGRTGVITPVAILEPVLIDGSTVAKASLHNFKQIEKLGLKIGDSVVVHKSGDIIPKVIKVLQDRRTGVEENIIKPKFCPTCDKLLLQEDILLKCQNLNCKDRLQNSIIHFASKNCANIQGLGSNIVKTLIKQGVIKDILDIYNITYDKLVGIETFKDKKINNLLEAIENSKNMPLDRFINSLSIEHIGEVASLTIAKKFSLGFVNVSKDDIVAIDGFGDEIANSLVEFLEINRSFIAKLINTIKPKELKIKEIKNNIFKDKRVVLTGTMPVNRSVIKKNLENLGAKIGSSISSNTHFLIYGQNSGSKLAKAKTEGTTTLSYDDYLKLL